MPPHRARRASASQALISWVRLCVDASIPVVVLRRAAEGLMSFGQELW